MAVKCEAVRVSLLSAMNGGLHGGAAVFVYVLFCCCCCWRKLDWFGLKKDPFHTICFKIISFCRNHVSCSLGNTFSCLFLCLSSEHSLTVKS